MDARLLHGLSSRCLLSSGGRLSGSRSWLLSGRSSILGRLGGSLHKAVVRHSREEQRNVKTNLLFLLCLLDGLLLGLLLAALEGREELGKQAGALGPLLLLGSLLSLKRNGQRASDRA